MTDPCQRKLLVTASPEQTAKKANEENCSHGPAETALWLIAGIIAFMRCLVWCAARFFPEEGHLVRPDLTLHQLDHAGRMHIGNEVLDTVGAHLVAEHG